MGIDRCVLPGCSTRYGDGSGRIIKRFPLAAGVDAKWMQIVPNISSKTALCELHFNKDQFENVRADGKRKFKSAAVPSPELCVKARALRTVRDGSLISLDHPYCRPQRPCPNVQEREAALQLLTLAAQPQEAPSTVQTEMAEVVTAEQQQVSSTLQQEMAELVTAQQQQVPSASDTVSNKDQEVAEPAQQQEVPPNDKDRLIAELRAENAQIREAIKQQERSKKEMEASLSKLQAVGNRYAALQRSHAVLKSTCFKLRTRVARAEKSPTPYLRSDQWQALHRKSTRGINWTDETFREGFILRHASGSTGYSKFVQRIPIFPSLRSLQERAQFMKFECGLVEEVFDLLEAMVPSMNDKEKDCVLVFDEMAIAEDERYNPSSGQHIGKATLPTHGGLANKALVVMLAGVSTRWKQTVAFHFSGQKTDEAKRILETQHKNLTGKALKDLVISVIKKTEEVGLRVAAVVSDMGADNQAMWGEFGVSGDRKDNVEISSFANPVREDARVQILPDPIHLFKAIKTMLENNVTVKLPDSIVKEEGLHSNIVSYQHIEDLYEYESQFELKVAFRLKPENLHVNKHFGKMNVGNHRAVVCHRTSVGLNRLADVTDNQSYKTTAWFVEMLNEFFELVSCRHRLLALSKFKPVQYKKSLDLIEKMYRIFSTMSVGDDGYWKPCQRGVKILCTSLLHLQEYFLDERGYAFLMLGRFTQDCLENLFSMIRLAQATPHALAFVQSLKIIALAQFSLAVKNSSYDHDESDHLIDFMSEARVRAAARLASKKALAISEAAECPIAPVTNDQVESIPEWESHVIYDMAGAIVKCVMDSTKLCSSCRQSLLWQSEMPHSCSIITVMKEYTMLTGEKDPNDMAQKAVSDPVFYAIACAEISFREYRQHTMNFKHANARAHFVDSLMYVWEGTGVPNCHHVQRKILEVFFRKRTKQYDAFRKHEMALKKKKSETESAQYSSKSVFKHAAGNNATVKKRCNASNKGNKNKKAATKKKRRCNASNKENEKMTPATRKKINQPVATSTPVRSSSERTPLQQTTRSNSHPLGGLQLNQLNETSGTPNLLMSMKAKLKECMTLK